MLHIVLVEPEIPPNTGNIARTCAATGVKLHLVEPLGFQIDDKTLKRAGLDYWPFVKLEVHKSLEGFLSQYGGDPKRRLFPVTTKGKQRYTDMQYRDGDMLIFGKETKGLPIDFIRQYEEHAIRIPMCKDSRLRSLNLSNAVNIVLFEALRQLEFPELD